MINLFGKDKEPQDLKGALKKIKSLENNVKELSGKLSSLEKKSRLFIQKIGMTRYNPFSNTGGNQSFTIALLDENNDGLVVTSIYSQDGNRVYSKPVKGGKSEFELSEEEKKAIEKANL